VSSIFFKKRADFFLKNVKLTVFDRFCHNMTALQLCYNIIAKVYNESLCGAIHAGFSYTHKEVTNANQAKETVRLSWLPQAHPRSLLRGAHQGDEHSIQQIRTSL